jgi:4-amino-4-deoxy-L-arabinose transferase-like glycosyltransferase
MTHGQVRAVAAAWCIGHLVLWGGAFAFAFGTPRLDGAEQLAWSYSLEWGYWKHPPLPTWVMHALVGLFGPSAALTYVTAQACVALALFIAFLAGCEWMDARRSLAAMVLASLIYFYNAGAEAFNHDVALLPLVAATLWLAFRAMRAESIAMWAAAGIVAGLALLTKYIAVLPFAALALALALDARAHTRRNALGAAASAVAAMLVFAPHLVWLVQHDWQPLRYAHALSVALAGNRFIGIAEFIGAIVVRILPALAVGYLVLRRRPRAASDAAVADRRFAGIIGAGPLVLTLAYAVVTGTMLPQRWAVPALLFTPWLVVLAWRGMMDDATWRRLLAVAVAAHVLLCLAATIVGPQVALARHTPGRTNFPAAAMAQAAGDTWREHGAQPLRFVIANSWLGGNLVAQRREPLAVLVEAQPNRAPWIPTDAAQRCGALVLMELTPQADHDPEIDAALLAFMREAQWRGEWALPWPGHAGDGSTRARIAWGIIAPQPGASCPL